MDLSYPEQNDAKEICQVIFAQVLTFRLEGQPERRGMTGGCPDARLVLKALKLVDQRPPAPPEGEETVMYTLRGQ